MCFVQQKNAIIVYQNLYICDIYKITQNPEVELRKHFVNNDFLRFFFQLNLHEIVIENNKEYYPRFQITIEYMQFKYKKHTLYIREEQLALRTPRKG